MGHRHKNSYCQRKSHEHKHHTIGLTLFSIIIGSRYSVGDHKGLYQSFNVGLGKVKITFGFNDHTLLECQKILFFIIQLYHFSSFINPIHTFSHFTQDAQHATISYLGGFNFLLLSFFIFLFFSFFNNCSSIPYRNSIFYCSKLRPHMISISFVGFQQHTQTWDFSLTFTIFEFNEGRLQKRISF